MKALIALVVIGVVVAVGIGLASNSQTVAERQFCDDLGDLQSALTSLTSLDPASASQGDFESDLNTVRNAWTNVKGEAQQLGEVNMNALDDAMDEFAQTAQSLPGNASVSDAEQAISESAQGVQSAVQSSKESYDCSDTSSA